jgi:hypothetical protein
MIESRSQAGHRRKMTSAQLAAQSTSSLCGGMESGINRIVAHWGSASGVDLPRSEPGAELLPPEAKIQLEENTASRLLLFGDVTAVLAGNFRLHRSLVVVRQLPQKFSSSQTLVLWSVPTIARWRPSGDGRPYANVFPFIS